MTKISAKPMALAIAAGFLLATLMPEPAYADPPPWAPAHGYRDKGKHKNKGKGKGKKGGGQDYGAVYTVPHGIDAHTCNRQTLGAVLGGITGAAVGGRLVKREDREIGMIGGAIIGVIVGGAIGQAMDNVDHNCIGQALEHGEDGQRVNWTNDDNGSRYSVTPERTYQTASGQYCREYQVTGILSGRQQIASGSACRQPDGSWKIVN